MTYHDAAPSSYWLVKTTEGVCFRVDEGTKHRIRDEYDRGVHVLEFTDVSGGQCEFVAKHYLGAWESTSDIRARERQISDLIDAEGETFT